MIPFERIFRLLNEHDVRYVIIGGIAVILHGSPRLTADLDIAIDLEPVAARRAIKADGRVPRIDSVSRNTNLCKARRNDRVDV